MRCNIMVDLIIINEQLKCVSLTIWKMLQTEGSIPIPEIFIEPEDEVSKFMSDNDIKYGGQKRNNQTSFKNIDRVNNLIKRESKGLPGDERVVAVKAGSVWFGKIIINDDIIIL